MHARDDLAAYLPHFTKSQVLVVGDVMLDRYVWGRVDRISPEAPIPVLRIERTAAMLGGAGNVVRNIAALHAQTFFVGLVGDDPAGRDILDLLKTLPGAAPHLISDQTRNTTIKTRFVAGVQQLLRADDETGTVPNALKLNELAKKIAAMPLGEKNAAIVLSDYGKGVLSDVVLRAAVDKAQKLKLPLIVDPKGKDFSRYRGATVVTPNRKELAEATGMPIDTDGAIVAAAQHLIKTCDLGAVLVTRSEQGMTLVVRDQAPLHLSAEAREVFDVSGAGDTVAANLATGLAAGMTLADAAALANVAAGIVVGKIGTASVTAEELRQKLTEIHVATAGTKVADGAMAAARAAAWRSAGLKVGFTNGCFDLLHPGHVQLLTEAAATCDRLIVGMNDDASVRRLKGADRPIQLFPARAAVLAALEMVDLVVGFGEDTPLGLITGLRPDVLIKGADYSKAQVVGAAEVEGWGGKVVLAQLLPGHSTTATVKKLAQTLPKKS